MRHETLPGLQPLDGVFHDGESSGEHPPKELLLLKPEVALKPKY
jgi:hypothetical protein